MFWSETKFFVDVSNKHDAEWLEKKITRFASHAKEEEISRIRTLRFPSTWGWQYWFADGLLYFGVEDGKIVIWKGLLVDLSKREAFEATGLMFGKIPDPIGIDVRGMDDAEVEQAKSIAGWKGLTIDDIVMVAMWYIVEL